MSSEQLPENETIYRTEYATMSDADLREEFAATVRLTLWHAERTVPVPPLPAWAHAVQLGPRAALEIAAVKARLALDLLLLKRAMQNTLAPARA